MSFPRYPEYKDSGVEWLGKIPSQWCALKGRHLFSNRRSPAQTGDEQLSATQKYGVVPQSHFMDIEQQKVTLALSGTGNFRHVESGDFVISLRSFQGGVEHSEYSGCVSPAYTVMKPSQEVVGTYFRFLLKSNDFISYLNVVSDGIRDGKTISYEQFASVVFPLPPKNEQATISGFLDHETARIDALIEEQQRLIELLKEKRQAVISHAVTKGLAPNVPMKDSGVEWLGEVPAHWGTCALGHLAKIDTGATPDRGNPSYWGGDIPWLKTGEINYNVITESEEKITEEGLANSSTRLAPEGTLLMAMYGQGVTRGRVAILGVKATYNQACAAIHVSQKLLNEYAFYYLLAAYNFIRETGNETSQMNLSAEIIGKIKMLVPPINQQQEIVEYLKETLPSFDLLAKNAQSSIELSKEHRTALISAAVTGKIDVRDWQAESQSSETKLPKVAENVGHYTANEASP